MILASRLNTRDGTLMFDWLHSTTLTYVGMTDVDHWL